MISKDKDDKLVRIYCYICDKFEELEIYCERFSNNNQPELVELLLQDYQPDDCCLDQNLLDSMPIITYSGKRSGKAATEITDKGYCSTKGMYYYGLKLHLLGFRRISRLPHPEQILFTPAFINDLIVFKEAWSELENRTFFGDKIYFVKELNQHMMKYHNSEMYSPIKAIKRMSEEVKQLMIYTQLRL